MEYYSVVKRNTFESVIMRWMNLEPIIQSEVSQKEKNKYIYMGQAYLVQMVKSLPLMQETQVQSLGGEDPLEKENGNPLQYSCLENPMDGGTWWATVHGVTKSQT